MADPLEALPPGFDAYKVLQVDPEADPEVIQAAYRRLAQKFHPDVAGPGSADRMAAINTAWEVLRDPGRRAAYDRRRAAPPPHLPDRPGSAGPSTSGWGPDAPVAPGGGSPASRSGGSRARPGAADPGSAPGPGRGRGAPAHTSGAPARGESVSPDWTSGRSNVGHGYDPATMRRPDGEGAAGPPPGGPSGSILNFGRYAGWSLGEIARVDVEYLEWLDRAPIGRAYRDELDPLLRRLGRRKAAKHASEQDRSGLYRRR